MAALGMRTVVGQSLSHTVENCLQVLFVHLSPRNGTEGQPQCHQEQCHCSLCVLDGWQLVSGGGGCVPPAVCPGSGVAILDSRSWWHLLMASPEGPRACPQSAGRPACQGWAENG